MRVNYEFIEKLAQKYTSDEARGVGYLPVSVYEKLARLAVDDLSNLDAADPLTKLEAQIILDGIVRRAKSELKDRYGRVQEEELPEGDTAILDSFLNEFVQGR